VCCTPSARDGIRTNPAAQENQAALDKVISTLGILSESQMCEVGVPFPILAGTEGFMSSKQVSVIGVEVDELQWVKSLIFLLRHPEPGTPELARQALLYLAKVADKRTPGRFAANH
jgi:hypothetical protein